MVTVPRLIDLCESYLLDQHSLILKLVLGYDLKLTVGSIQTIHMVFASPSGLWKVVARVPCFVMSNAAINAFIGFKAVPQVLQLFSYVGKCHRKVHQGPLG